MRTFHLDRSGEFRRQLARVLANSRKTAAEFGEQQAGLFIQEALAITPPGDASTRGPLARQRGEAAVERDIRKVFRPAKGREKGMVSASGMKIVHHRSRNSRGRVPGRINAGRHPVKKGNLSSYIKSTKAHVGRLAAGWNISAARFKRRPPAWIWRHRTPGSVSVQIGPRGVRVRMINGMGWASEVDDLERRLHWAMDKRAHALRRLADNYAARLRRGTNFRP